MTDYSPSYIGNFYTRVADGTFVESNEQPWFQGGHGYPVLRHPDGTGDWIFPNLPPYDLLFMRADDGWVSVAPYGNKIDAEQNITNLSKAGLQGSGVMSGRVPINTTYIIDGTTYVAGSNFPAHRLEYRDSCFAGYHKDNIFAPFEIVKSGTETACAGGCPIDTKLIGGQATANYHYIANDGDPFSIQVTLTLQQSVFAGQVGDAYVYFPQEIADNLREAGAFVFFVTSPSLFDVKDGFVSDFTINPITPPTYSSYFARVAKDATDVVGNAAEIFSCSSNIPLGTQVVLDIPLNIYNAYNINGVFCISVAYYRPTDNGQFQELDRTFVEQNAVFITEPPATLDYGNYLTVDVLFNVTASGVFKAIP